MSITLEKRQGFDWFSPKEFESKKGYERLGIRPFKKYLPTSGDLAMRRILPDKQVHPNLASLQDAEERTRRLERDHLWLFGLYAGMSTAFEFERGGAPIAALILALNVVVNIGPACIQRYNRIRLLSAIEKMKKRSVSRSHSSTA